MKALLLLLVSIIVEGWITRPTMTHRRRSVLLYNSFHHALAIVPPDDTWDTLQRARYFANDRSYTKWPPCLRLFHPLEVTDETALDIANLIEKYEIEPFEIRLKKWSIIPHAEAMEADWEVTQTLPKTKTEQRKEKKTDIEQLIAQEEEKGRQNLRKRLQRQGKSVPKLPYLPKEVSKLERQQKMYEEFNGPCVVALEPDDESRERLLELRALLEEELFPDFAAYSPTSSVAAYDVLPKNSEANEYRPLITIGSFQTVAAAIQMARTLRKEWKTLKFTVTDLQLISCQMKQDNPFAVKTSWLSHAQDEEQNLSDDGQFGCDAMIMLYGEETEEEDDDVCQDMIALIAQEGQDGGYGRTNADEIVEESSEKIQHWLEEDDFDEGTVLLMGRTYFFTGEMRLYVGMPATSVMDGKDRVSGDTGISGASRRRGTTHRSGNLWEDGEWGRKEVDLQPWSKAERSKISRMKRENEDVSEEVSDEMSE